MNLLKHKLTIIILLAGVAIAILGINQVIYLRKAHSAFENYYAFRGCIQLLQKTPDYGICKTNAGQTIKIVKFQNKWYLDGDLPFCMGKICL